MAETQTLYAMDLPGFWMDVGQPPDYLKGMVLYLNSVLENEPAKVTPTSTNGTEFIGPVLVHPTATIGANCKIGPNVVVGPNVTVGEGVRLQRCTLMEDVRVKSHAWIESCIIGWRSTVGEWARMEGVCVLGEDVEVKDELHLNGARVLPHKSISASVHEPTIIM